MEEFNKNIMKNKKISFSILIIIGLTLLQCKNDKTPAANGPIDVNTISGEDAFKFMYDVASDSCGSVTLGDKTTAPPKPTNSEEVKADKKKVEKVIEDLEKSEYKSCEEILIDYQNRIESLRKGDTKPLGEFPLATDPKIAVCIKTDPAFALKMDSLKKESNVLLDKILSANDKF